MGIGKRIKEAREIKGLTQVQLAKLIGVTPSAITNYESDTSHPKEQILYDLMKHLNVDANFLFQDAIDFKRESFTAAEIEQIHKFRSLDDYGKTAVNSMLEHEYRRVTSTSGQFFTREDAYQYLTSTQIFAMGGFDPEQMNSDELIELANELYTVKTKQ